MCLIKPVVGASSLKHLDQDAGQSVNRRGGKASQSLHESCLVNRSNLVQHDLPLDWMNGLGIRTPRELPMGIRVVFMAPVYPHCDYASIIIFAVPTY